MSLSPPIACERVHRRHRSGDEVVPVLRGASLEVKAGELVLLTGPSGSGKTTLLSILAGLMPADAGKVWLAGKPLHGLTDHEKAHVRRGMVGFVFQAFHLFEALSARDNVVQALLLTGLDRKAAQQRAEEALARVGLAERLHHRPRQLSQGQKQRVAVARATAGSAPVIFADEPTAALDGETGQSVMQLLRDAAQDGAAVLVVTHDLRLQAFAHRVLHVEAGVVLGADEESP